MTQRSILLVAVLLPLAACNSGPTVEAENATAEEVAAQVEAAGGTDAFVSPGKWRSKVTIESISLPGMPPEMTAQMKERAASQMTTETCLTQQDVEKPSTQFFGGQNNSCKYDRFTMGGGKIDTQMTCGAPGPQQTMTMTGTYSPTTYSVTASSRGAGDGAAGLVMEMRIDAERVGECDAGTAG